MMKIRGSSADARRLPITADISDARDIRRNAGLDQAPRRNRKIGPDVLTGMALLNKISGGRFDGQEIQKIQEIQDSQAARQKGRRCKKDDATQDGYATQDQIDAVAVCPTIFHSDAP